MKKRKILLNAALIILTTALAIGGVLALLLPGGEKKDSVVLSGVFEIWHTENFEGGKGSRASILTAAGNRVNKRHRQVFFVVRTLTEEQIAEKISGGESPDLISFSYGAADSISLQLHKLSNIYGLREDYCRAGRLEGSQLALPYTAGGYALIALEDRLASAGINKDSKLKDNIYSCGLKAEGKRKKDIYSVCVGNAAYNDPYCLLDKAAGTLPLMTGLSQFDAYDFFMQRGQSTMLLGTQRDLMRIAARVSQNTMPPYRVEAYDRTDLLQFIAVSTSGADRQTVCAEFLSELYSVAGRDTVKSAGLMTADGRHIYGDDELMHLLEAALDKEQELISVFASSKYLTDKRAQSLSKL